MSDDTGALETYCRTRSSHLVPRVLSPEKVALRGSTALKLKLSSQLKLKQGSIANLRCIEDTTSPPYSLIRSPQ